ncbi:MAG: BPL-N domain-containing protein [Planctomycetales bacterium]
MTRPSASTSLVWIVVSLLLGETALAADPPAQAEASDKKAATTRVAVYGDKGTGSSVQVLLGALRSSPDLDADRITAAEIREGKLSGYDVILHPGGGARVQGNTLGDEGREKVRQFVRNGGGYVGICAGAYLATGEVDAYLGILDADVVDFEHWARGKGEVEISLTPQGRQLLGADADRLKIEYAQGPLLAPAGKADLPDYEPLAKFETEIALKGAPRGVMVGTSAIVTGRYGEGRIICFSPHPEKTKGLRGFVQRGALWAAGRQPKP